MPNLIDKEKVVSRIDDIRNVIAELKKYQTMEPDSFLSNKNNFYLASYWMRIGLEAVITISTHILSRLPVNGKKKDYTQTLLCLADYGVLPKDFAAKIKGMTGYRNRLVHLYWEVKPAELLSIIKEDLNDFEEFIRHIKHFLKK